MWSDRDLPLGLTYAWVAITSPAKDTTSSLAWFSPSSNGISDALLIGDNGIAALTFCEVPIGN